MTTSEKGEKDAATRARARFGSAACPVSPINAITTVTAITTVSRRSRPAMRARVWLYRRNKPHRAVLAVRAFRAQRAVAQRHRHHVATRLVVGHHGEHREVGREPVQVSHKRLAVEVLHIETLHAPVVRARQQRATARAERTAGTNSKPTHALLCNGFSARWRWKGERSCRVGAAVDL
jgi:hypothetical protein